MKVVKLRKNEERRIQAGHLWVFSNEIDSKVTPLQEFESGQAVSIESSRGAFLGHGYINPHSLIAARICSRVKSIPFDAELIRQRLIHALSLRDALFDKPYYRLLHSEGDFLPGVIVDRYDDVLVVQINTAGMELITDDFLQVLEDILSPRVILLRNDSAIRSLESLEQYTRVALGELPEAIELQENGLIYQTSLDKGQKTGWFYDHRENRAYLQRLAQGKSVLDVFSYIGGWGLNAAVAGATEVVAIDASESALAAAMNNATLNHVDDKFSTLHGDACAKLRELQDQGKHFDIIVLDPPAYIKRKKDHRKGLQQYELINRLAISLLNKNGILVSASCSQHLSRNELANAMLRASRKNRSDLQIFYDGGQGADHPVNAAMQETQYLKAIFSRAMR